MGRRVFKIFIPVIKMKEKNRKIIKGVPERIEKKFDTNEFQYGCGRVDIDVYKGFTKNPDKRIVKARRRSSREKEDIWEIEINLTEIGNKLIDGVPAEIEDKFFTTGNGMSISERHESVEIINVFRKDDHKQVIKARKNVEGIWDIEF